MSILVEPPWSLHSILVDPKNEEDGAWKGGEVFANPRFTSSAVVVLVTICSINSTLWFPVLDKKLRIFARWV